MNSIVKKLIVKMSLQKGEYVFDDGNQVTTMPIADCEDVTYNTEDEIIEQYDFSEDLLERVDCLLYNGLKDYDKQNESNYATKYLNMTAKDIERKPRESKTKYKNRVTQMRSEILENIGLELNYDVAVIGASEDLSMSDRLFMKKVAQKQKENGANVNIHIAYKNTEKYSDQNEEIVSDEFLDDSFDYYDESSSFDGTSSQEEERYERTVVNSGEQQYEIRVDTSAFGKIIKERKNGDGERVVEPYNIRTREKDKSKFKRSVIEGTVNTDIFASEDEKQEVLIGEIDIPDLKHDEDDKRVIDESEKSKYEIKVNESYASKFAAAYEAGQTEDGNRKIEPYDIRTMPKKDIFRKQAKVSDVLTQEDQQKAQDTENKILEYKPKTKEDGELQFVEIKNGKMLGVDEDRPSAVVETFTIEMPETTKPESEENEIIDFKSRKLKIMGNPIKDGRVQRFIRKFKDVKDKIQNKVFVSKTNIKNKKFLISGVIGVLALASVATVGSKFISNIKSNTKYEIECENKTSRSNTQESKVDKEYEYTKTAQDLKKEMNAQQSVQDRKTQITDTKKYKENENVKNTKYNKENKTDSSTEYLKSVRVGSRMSINKGSYFETPEGTGKVGYFRKHKDNVKIISKIGIATKEGYTSISTSDVSLLELKEKYPDAEFSYHIVDEKGNIFGWMTSKSFEEHISKDQPQIDDER